MLRRLVRKIGEYFLGPPDAGCQEIYLSHYTPMVIDVATTILPTIIQKYDYPETKYTTDDITAISLAYATSLIKQAPDYQEP